MLEFLCLDSACTEVQYLFVKVKALALLFTIRSVIVHHPLSAPPLNRETLLRTAFGNVAPCC